MQRDEVHHNDNGVVRGRHDDDDAGVGVWGMWDTPVAQWEAWTTELRESEYGTEMHSNDSGQDLRV